MNWEIIVGNDDVLTYEFQNNDDAFVFGETLGESERFIDFGGDENFDNFSYSSPCSFDSLSPSSFDSCDSPPTPISTIEVPENRTYQGFLELATQQNLGPNFIQPCLQTFTIPFTSSIQSPPQNVSIPVQNNFLNEMNSYPSTHTNPFLASRLSSNSDRNEAFVTNDMEEDKRNLKRSRDGALSVVLPKDILVKASCADLEAHIKKKIQQTRNLSEVEEHAVKRQRRMIQNRSYSTTARKKNKNRNSGITK